MIVFSIWYFSAVISKEIHAELSLQVPLYNSRICQQVGKWC